MDVLGIDSLKNKIKKTGVLLINLGTPDAPTKKAVREYLSEFLSDVRVIDKQTLLWKIILHGIILRVRPKRSAKLYQKIWREDGISPLLYNSRKTAFKLDRALGNDYSVKLGIVMESHPLQLLCKVLQKNPFQESLFYHFTHNIQLRHLHRR